MSIQACKYIIEDISPFSLEGCAAPKRWRLSASRGDPQPLGGGSNQRGKAAPSDPWVGSSERRSVRSADHAGGAHDCGQAFPSWFTLPSPSLLFSVGPPPR